jgi:hypothetical protein
MRYFLLMLAFVALFAGCTSNKPKQAGPGHNSTAATTPEKVTPPQPAEAPAEVKAEPTGEGETPAGPTENPKPEVKIPKPDIPVADAETQKKIDEAIKKFKDISAKWDEREDAMLKTLVGIGAIATPDVLKLSLDRDIEPEAAGIILKFFYLLPEKERNTALVYQLFNDDSTMRGAANTMLVRLTGKKDIGYDANGSEADRYAAIKKWAEALGVKGIE